MQDIERNQATVALQRLGRTYDQQSDQALNFLQRQSNGEAPDPEQFMKLLERHSVTQEAMYAQVKLYQKPLQTVLNEAK